MDDGWRVSGVMITTDTVKFDYILFSRQTRGMEKVVVPRAPAASSCLALQPWRQMLFNPREISKYLNLCERVPGRSITS